MQWIEEWIEDIIKEKQKYSVYYYGYLVQFNVWRKIDTADLDLRLYRLDYVNISPCAFFNVEMHDDNVTLLKGFLKVSPCYLHKINKCKPKYPRDKLWLIRQCLH